MDSAVAGVPMGLSAWRDAGKHQCCSLYCHHSCCYSHSETDEAFDQQWTFVAETNVRFFFLSSCDFKPLTMCTHTKATAVLGVITPSSVVLPAMPLVPLLPIVLMSILIILASPLPPSLHRGTLVQWDKVVCHVLANC